jgi:hypothetical protein
MLTGCGRATARDGAGAGAATGASRASVSIGAIVYEFRATCYDAGAGSVVAIGAGVEPGTGKPTRAVVQAFLADSYVGVTVGDRDAVFESSLDDPLTLGLDDGTIDATGLRFVRDLDLANGHSTVAGDGAVHVACASYAPGLPPGYAR